MVQCKKNCYGEGKRNGNVRDGGNESEAEIVGSLNARN